MVVIPITGACLWLFALLIPGVAGFFLKCFGVLLLTQIAFCFFVFNVLGVGQKKKGDTEWK